MNADYDIAVIGGGIHGAGVAQAAAAAGYRVVVLEKSALAAGTSSRSSKLIHGGLRYLESGQFSLVRECLRERSLLLKNAPDLVQLKRFYIPVYAHTRRSPLLIRIGLTLYSLFTGFGPGAGFRKIPRRKWSTLDGLQTEGLKAVYQYWDAQTDDKKLTQAVMRSACDMGAELIMPVTLSSAEREADGFQICYCQDGEQKFLNCKVLVNAAGPWANEVLDRVSPRVTKRSMDLVQGAHIILDAHCEQGVYYLEAPQDGRAVFVMPWYGRLMVGTTEHIYKGDPAAVEPMAEEKTYLLNTLKAYFPQYQSLGEAEIVEAFAGLRVLPSADKAAFSRSRETVYHTDHADKPHLLTIYGGKLTAYRATAERVIKLIAPSLPKAQMKADTRKLKLSQD